MEIEGVGSLRRDVFWLYLVFLLEVYCYLMVSLFLLILDPVLDFSKASTSFELCSRGTMRRL